MAARGSAPAAPPLPPRVELAALRGRRARGSSRRARWRACRAETLDRGIWRPLRATTPRAPWPPASSPGGGPSWRTAARRGAAACRRGTRGAGRRKERRALLVSQRVCIQGDRFHPAVAAPVTHCAVPRPPRTLLAVEGHALRALYPLPCSQGAATANLPEAVASSCALFLRVRSFLRGRTRPLTPPRAPDMPHGCIPAVYDANGAKARRAGRTGPPVRRRTRRRCAARPPPRPPRRPPARAARTCAALLRLAAGAAAETAARSVDMAAGRGVASQLSTALTSLVSAALVFSPMKINSFIELYSTHWAA